jgi:hypothetical protein
VIKNQPLPDDLKHFEPAAVESTRLKLEAHASSFAEIEAKIVRARNHLAELRAYLRTKRT